MRHNISCKSNTNVFNYFLLVKILKVTHKVHNEYNPFVLNSSSQCIKLNQQCKDKHKTL